VQQLGEIMAPTQTAKLQFLNDNGVGPGAPDLIQLISVGGGAAFAISSGGGEIAPQVVISANGAINPRFAEDYVITKAGVAVMTLAAPTAVLDDGTTISVTSSTDNAHTITATALINDGTTGSPHNVATFAAFRGAYIVLIAYNGFWYVKSRNNVNIT